MGPSRPGGPESIKVICQNYRMGIHCLNLFFGDQTARSDSKIRQQDQTATWCNLILQKC